MTYNITNWYWNVGNSTTQVWSSARVEYVPLTDATYVAWCNAGNVATNIDNTNDLASVFAAQYPQGWPQPLSVQATNLLNSGVVVTFTKTTSLSATYKTDLDTQVNIVSEAANLMNPANTTQTFIGGDASFTLYDTSGIPRVMTPGIFQVFEAAYAAWIKSVKIVRDSNIGTLPPDTITINA